MFKNIDFNRINGYLLLFFTFAFPLSRAIASIFMVYFSLYFIVALLKREYPKDFFQNRLVIVILIFIFYMLISNLWNGIDNDFFGRGYLQWFAIFGIAIYIYKNPSYLYKIITAFILGMLVSEVLSYGMYFNLWRINGKGSSMPTPFMLHLMYSVFLAVTSILLLNRILSNKYSFKEKILLAIFFLTVTGNLLISNGRTGQVGFFVAIIAVFILHFKRPIKAFFIALTLILILFFTGYHTLTNFKSRVDNTIYNINAIFKHDYKVSWGRRVAMWIITPDLVKEKPIFGWGVGGVNGATKELFKQKDFGFSKDTIKFISNHHLHNQYLQTIVEGGIVGIILLFLIYYYILKLKIKDVEIKHLSILFIIIYLFSSFGDPLLIKQFTRILFILFIGIFLGSTFSEQKGLDE